MNERAKTESNKDLLKNSITEKEAASYTGMSRSFLRQARCSGDRINRTPGPRYLKIGRAIRYLKKDLDIWLEQHRCSQNKHCNFL